MEVQKEYILEFLSIMEKNPDDIAKKKHGTSREISYFDLIKGLLEHSSLVEYSTSIGVDDKTIQRSLKKCFPTINTMGKSWNIYILSCLNLKQCSKCKKLLKLCEFYQYKSEGRDLISPHCKDCAKEKYILNKPSYDEYRKQHYLNNKGYYLSKRAKYRSDRNKRTPIWADIEKIKLIYTNCPVGYHVDHVIPLHGTHVSGLHVENNLQYLLAKDNLSKSNRFMPT
jgi:hypothetical protein